MDKSKLMMIIIIALLVILLGTVVAVTFYLLNIVGEESPDDFQAIAPPVVENQLTLMDLVEVPLGDRISTNLAVSPDGRAGMVSADVVVGVNGTIDAAELETFLGNLNSRIGFARSIVLDVLFSLQFEEVRTVEGRDVAAEIIKNRLQEAFNTNLIITVRFSNWSAQASR